MDAGWPGTPANAPYTHSGRRDLNDVLFFMMRKAQDESNLFLENGAFPGSGDLSTRESPFQVIV